MKLDKEFYQTVSRLNYGEYEKCSPKCSEVYREQFRNTDEIPENVIIYDNGDIYEMIVNIEDIEKMKFLEASKSRMILDKIRKYILILTIIAVLGVIGSFILMVK